MPRSSVRLRRRTRGILSFAIAALSIAALVLIAVILFVDRSAPEAGEVDLVRDAAGDYVDARAMPTEGSELVLNALTFADRPASGAPAETPTPSPTPAPTPTPEPTYNPAEPYALVRPTPMAEGFLPVFKRANTTERKIAITLDECSGVTITRKFINLARKHGAKLTLFPTGDNLLRDGMGTLLRNALFKEGFELENRCYNTMAHIYRLSDSMMAAEIWKQSIAMSYVLEVDYQPHFLRLYGGLGENDGRTHAYLAQQGYLGVASWTVNGSVSTADQLANSLAPGNIYCFKTTEKDAKLMRALMQAAKAQGYEMVTLNSLFGYEMNSAKEIQGSILSATLPELEDYDGAYYFMRSGDAAWAVGRLQRRLMDLGYLEEGNVDCVFGNGTAAALSAFQAKAGLAASGAADVETQRRLYADDAPPGQGPGPQ